MRPIERPYLIQRLQRPLRVPENANPLFKAMAAGAAGPFSFGGGYARGGLSEEGNKILGEVFRFDYMGSAEFEYGAVPKALQKISEATKDLLAFDMSIAMADVEPNWRRKYQRLGKDSKLEKLPARATGVKHVFVICHKDHFDPVTDVISQLAKKEDAFDLKERCGLSSALDPVSEWDGETCGWLELETGYMFFTDEEMFGKVVLLFLGKEWRR